MVFIVFEIIDTGCLTSTGHPLIEESIVSVYETMDKAIISLGQYGSVTEKRHTFAGVYDENGELVACVRRFKVH